MAYLVYCGHHIVLEVIEIWNRQLDFLAIERPQQLAEGIIPNTPTISPYIYEEDPVERKLPYAMIGNDAHFLNSLYADKVMLRAKNQLDEELDLSYSLSF